MILKYCKKKSLEKKGVIVILFSGAAIRDVIYSEI